MLPIYTFHRGSLPLLISIPHAGTEVPREVLRTFTSSAQALPDTDWHVNELYGFARELGASVLVASYSRYVVDLNRSPDSTPLYAKDPTSPVCPTLTFHGDPIYMSGDEPDEAQIRSRIETFWRPYHDRLAQELAELRAEHPVALLWDAHSVASEVPGLFAGVLPEFNLGTRDDASCPREIAETLLDMVTRDGKYGAVLNGRFKGGFITAHYGQPSEGVYAIQLELAQRLYMEEGAHLNWHEERAHSTSQIIERLLRRYVAEAVGG